jgi:hypothetical protein
MADEETAGDLIVDRDGVRSPTMAMAVLQGR